MPVGGGGLISGVAGVVKTARPEVRVIGVQVEALRAVPGARSTRARPDRRAEAADDRRRDRDQAARARSRCRWSSAGSTRSSSSARTTSPRRWCGCSSARSSSSRAAAPSASPRSLAGQIAAGATRLDGDRALGRQRRAGLLAAIAQRHETTAGRRLRLFTRISDRPGGLAALLTLIAEAGGNVVHADHVREAVPLHVRETGVEIALETRGAEHGEAIVAALDAGRLRRQPARPGDSAGARRRRRRRGADAALDQRDN